MQERLGDRQLAHRHRGTLGGRLKDLETTLPVHVILVLAAGSATSRSGQLLATHAANLLGRMEGVVGSLACIVEGPMPALRPDVDPRNAEGGEDLLRAIERCATLATPTRWTPPRDVNTPVLRVGIGRTATSCDLSCAATSWGAYIGTRRGPDCLADGGSVGPFTAAAFAAAEVFRAARMTGASAVHPAALCFDAWRWTFVDALDAVDAGTPDSHGLVLPRSTLVGIGAVGCAAALTLWTSRCDVEAMLVDGDVLSLTNLNRYVLFSREDVGVLKVDRTVSLLGHRGITETSRQGSRFVPFAGWWSDYMRHTQGAPENIVLSAVDTNSARHQLQDALPRLLLGASTLNLRAEVGRYDLSSEQSRCLKCFNRPEETESDALVHRRLLGLDVAGLERAADERGVSLDELQRYVAELRRGGHGCGILTGDALDKLRRTQSEEAFAVSFVSSLAGTLLAAQLVREAVGAPLLRPPMTRAQFQFERPESADANACFIAPRDSQCDCAGVTLRAAHRQLWPALIGADR